MNDNSAKFDRKTIFMILGYISSYRLQLLLVFICIVISAAVSAGSALFIKVLIDSYIVPLLAQSDPVFTGLLEALTFMAFIYAAGILATLIYNRVMVTIAQGTLKKIRDDMFSRMQYLPVSYFDRHTYGEIMSLYTNDTDTLRQMIAQSMAQLMNSVFTVVAVFFSMLYLSVWLTVISVLTMAVIMKIMSSLITHITGYFIAQQRSLAALNGFVEEMVQGQKVVKVFCHEEAAREDMRVLNDDWALNATTAASHANSIMTIMNFVSFLLYIILAAAGAWMAIKGISNISLAGKGTMTLGMIASFLTLSRNFTNPIAQLSNQFNSIITALAGADRIRKFMEEAPETDEGYVTLVNAKEEEGVLTETKERTGLWAWRHPHGDGTLSYQKLEGGVVLDHVDFSYEPEKQVLFDITLYARPGQKVAFVGATGAGKTTITNLINRFYDIDDGKIRYDGININKIKKHDLRHSLGVVLQDVNLFTDTVMENIRFGRAGATDDECIEAATLANAHDFITRLPEGYDTVIKGDGSSLSQGQRQLISIARAAVADPPVMILDEATSSIDTRTEALVQDGMDKLMRGRTVFVIAHRLSTVKNSDVIMVMDHGRIIERGTHDELIKKGGIYYHLYTGAFELE